MIKENLPDLIPTDDEIDYEHQIKFEVDAYKMRRLADD